MKHLLWVCILTSVAVIPTFAQRPVSVEVGAYVGVPLNHTLEPTFCCTTAAAFFGYETRDASYTTGVSAGVVLHDRIHVSFGAMYMPVSFRSVGTNCCPLTQSGRARFRRARDTKLKREVAIKIPPEEFS